MAVFKLKKTLLYHKLDAQLCKLWVSFSVAHGKVCEALEGLEKLMIDFKWFDFNVNF